MSHMRKGQLTEAGEWRKHLRPYGRRQFWKVERKAEVIEAKQQQLDGALEDMDYMLAVWETLRPRKKRPREKRLFTIEWRWRRWNFYNLPTKKTYWTPWQRYKAYKKREQRDQALEQMIKGATGMPSVQYRAIDR